MNKEKEKRALQQKKKDNPSTPTTKRLALPPPSALHTAVSSPSLSVAHSSSALSSSPLNTPSKDDTDRAHTPAPESLDVVEGGVPDASFEETTLAIERARLEQLNELGKSLGSALKTSAEEAEDDADPEQDQQDDEKEDTEGRKDFIRDSRRSR
jgi:hypothetical protein